VRGMFLRCTWRMKDARRTSAPRLPAGSAGPPDTTSAQLTQATAPTDAAGARRLAANGRPGGDVGLLQAGSTRQPCVAAELRLANGSMPHAEDRLAVIPSRHATGSWRSRSTLQLTWPDPVRSGVHLPCLPAAGYPTMTVGQTKSGILQGKLIGIWIC
jgi:hypothetical protein